MPHALTDKVSSRAEDAKVLELASTVSSVPAARHIVADHLRTTRLPSALVDNALVVVTELVSNAILHARPLTLSDSRQGVLLRWSLRGRRISIEVTDGGGAERPELKKPVSAELEGRGLAIVDALAKWTVRAEGGRVTVHAIVGPWRQHDEGF